MTQLPFKRAFTTKQTRRVDGDSVCAQHFSSANVRRPKRRRVATTPRRVRAVRAVRVVCARQRNATRYALRFSSRRLRRVSRLQDADVLPRSRVPFFDALDRSKVSRNAPASPSTPPKVPPSAPIPPNSAKIRKNSQKFPQKAINFSSRPS